MDPDLLRAQAALEKTHWWFAARRRILDGVVAGLGLPRAAQILEAGCGPGGNLPMLASHGTVSAFDVSPVARTLATEAGCAKIAAGSLPGPIPFADGAFDLVVLLDVLEHIEDDGAALAALRASLKPGGRLLITVPALPALWSYHDEQHRHFRRYRKAELRDRLLQAGFQPLTLTYFNTLLFPLVAGARLLRRLGGSTVADDLQPPPSWLNWLLTEVFASERYLVGHVPMPVGVSLLAVARVGSPSREGEPGKKGLAQEGGAQVGGRLGGVSQVELESRAFW